MSIRLSLSQKAKNGKRLELHMARLLDSVYRAMDEMRKENGGHGSIRIAPVYPMAGMVVTVIHDGEPFESAVRRMISCSEVRSILIEYQPPQIRICLPQKV